MRKTFRYLLAVFVTAGGLLAGPVPRAEAAAVCTANVSFTYAPGITGALPTAQAVTGTLVLTCPVLSPDAGMHIFPFAGPGSDSCVLGTGRMTVVGGFFDYTRGWAGDMFLIGSLPMPSGAPTFIANAEWVPVLLPGDCVSVPVTGAVATGAAVVA